MIDAILTYIIPALIAGLVTLFLGRNQNRKIKVDIEGQYQALLSKEIEERRKLAERFDIVEQKLDKWERAYKRSLHHIRKIDPDNPVPDFLEWDTGRLQKYYQERFGE